MASTRKKVESVVRSVHPLEPTLCGIQGVIITGLPEGDDVDLCSVAIVGEGQARRSPSGTGVAAVMAVADAMGVLGHSRSFVLESLMGARLTGSFVQRTTIGEMPAIVTRIDGTAWIIGDHEFMVCDDDPFRDGFRL